MLFTSGNHSASNCISVITNGTLEWKHYEKALPYLDEVSISIDRYSAESCFIRDEGIMPKVISTIKIMKKIIKTHLISTLHKKNRNDMSRYIEFANLLGVTHSFSIFTANISNELFKEYILDTNDLIEIEQNLMNLSKNVKVNDMPIDGINLCCRERCESGNKLVSIDAKGDIYPCHMLHIDEVKLGNIFESTIEDIVFSEQNPFQNLNVDDFKECNVCDYKYLCGGGCRGRSYLYYNDLKSKDGYCVMIKNYYKDIVDLLKSKIS